MCTQDTNRCNGSHLGLRERADTRMCWAPGFRGESSLKPGVREPPGAMGTEMASPGVSLGPGLPAAS